MHRFLLPLLLGALPAFAAREFQGGSHLEPTPQQVDALPGEAGVAPR